MVEVVLFTQIGDRYEEIFFSERARYIVTVPWYNVPGYIVPWYNVPWYIHNVTCYI